MYNITIYGSNTLATLDSNSEALDSEVLGHSGLVEYTTDILGPYAKIEHEGEELIGLGKTLGYQRFDRDSLALELYPISVIDPQASFVDVSPYQTFLANIKTVLAKRYHYIGVNNNDNTYDLHDSGRFVCVSGLQLDIGSSNGFKTITLNCKKRLING